MLCKEINVYNSRETNQNVQIFKGDVFILQLQVMWWWQTAALGLEKWWELWDFLDSGATLANLADYGLISDIKISIFNTVAGIMTYDCLEHYRSHFPRSPKEELPVAFLSRLSATTGGAWQRTFLFKVRGVDLASRQQARVWFDGRRLTERVPILSALCLPVTKMVRELLLYLNPTLQNLKGITTGMLPEFDVWKIQTRREM